MSVFREREVACSACGVRAVRSVALSIHGSRAPAILDEIRAGTFHRFACASCGVNTLLDGPLLVIDFVRPWWLQLYPRVWVPAWRALERDAERRFDESLAVNAPEVMRARAPDFVRRVTFGMDALREKIILRDAAMDDVSIEVFKMLLYARRTDATVPMLRVVEADATTIKIAGAPEGVMVAQREGIERITAEAPLADARAKLSAGPFVDAQRIYEAGTQAPPPGSVASRP